MLSFGTGLFTLLSAASASGSQGSFEINISNVDGGKGEVIVSVYSEEEAWLHIPKGVFTKRVEPSSKNMTVVLEGIPHGTYAVCVVQDMNSNDKVDMSWFPYPHPSEASGTSNNAEALVGPPSFDDSKFAFNTSKKTLDIELGF